VEYIQNTNINSSSIGINKEEAMATARRKTTAATIKSSSGSGHSGSVTVKDSSRSRISSSVINNSRANIIASGPFIFITYISYMKGTGLDVPVCVALTVYIIPVRFGTAQDFLPNPHFMFRFACH
jgi:hypothetical protein